MSIFTIEPLDLKIITKRFSFVKLHLESFQTADLEPAFFCNKINDTSFLYVGDFSIKPNLKCGEPPRIEREPLFDASSNSGCPTAPLRMSN